MHDDFLLALFFPFCVFLVVIAGDESKKGRKYSMAAHICVGSGLKDGLLFLQNVRMEPLFQILLPHSLYTSS